MISTDILRPRHLELSLESTTGYVVPISNRLGFHSSDCLLEGGNHDEVRLVISIMRYSDWTQVVTLAPSAPKAIPAPR